MNEGFQYFLSILTTIFLGTWLFKGWDAAYWVLIVECVILGIGLVLWLFLAWANWQLPKMAEEKLRSITKAEVEKHMETLARKRMMLLKTDDYGNVNPKPWTDEIARFINSNILPKLSQEERNALKGKWSDVATDLIEGPVADRNASLERELSYDESMSPTMFEHYCASLLRKAGWACDVTKASGDQGVDVVATKNGTKIALQCKKYGSPVGNAAVQEVAAARIHVGATVAAVVSNTGYTRSARELAARTKTLLLHHAELPRLDEILAE
jgi:restriction system protein